MTYVYTRNFKTEVEKPDNMTEDDFNMEMAEYEEQLGAVYEWARNRIEQVQNDKGMREFTCTVTIL